MNTQILTEKQIAEAAQLLIHGKLVGIPTETVYGLGANALDPQAVAHIFHVKGRPQDNPLILHLADASWIQRYCENIPEQTWALTEHFWPGALTLILPVKSSVPSVVRAGLPTVGVRCPDHSLTLSLLSEADIPVAAPSGNLSGKPSPTTAEAMLEDMSGKIPAILQGGACSIGVESTILELGRTPRLLRAGGVSVEALESVLGEKIIVDSGILGQEKDVKPRAPGMKYRHYAPEAPVTVVIGENSADWIAKEAQAGDGVICFAEDFSYFPTCICQILGKEKDLTEQARQVFSALRFFNQTEVPRIWAQCPTEEGLGLAVANRLQKAAGFQVVRLDEAEG